MKKIEINGITYEIVRDDANCFCKEDIEEKVTDYFEPYDYIFGDYAYEKVRLKGYYDSNNKNANKINDIKFLDDYIENYCSFGSKTFLLKKLK